MSTSAITLCAHTNSNTWSYWNKYFMDILVIIKHSYVSFIMFIFTITFETLVCRFDLMRAEG